MDAEAYCTYQPPSVRVAFIMFQCLLPGVCGLLAAWGAYTFPLVRSAHAELVAGISAHKNGDDDVQDPITKVQIPVPSSDPERKAAQAAYDHYSDSELQAAASMPNKTDALSLLKGSITKGLGLEIGILVSMLLLVLVAAAKDTSKDMLWLSAAVAFASLVSALVVFFLAFDVIRLQHVSTLTIFPATACTILVSMAPVVKYPVRATALLVRVHCYVGPCILLIAFVRPGS